MDTRNIILSCYAANYFLNEWDGIEVIASYGDVAWDNNLIERTKRPVEYTQQKHAEMMVKRLFPPAQLIGLARLSERFVLEAGTVHTLPYSGLSVT